ncbi:MAG TPA: cyclophane-forming radical SAM peptide maturase AmcB [Micromonosporaceae bacterium]
MRGISPVPGYVIMQPTTLCNLDCKYCYLPHRVADRRMPVPVARAVADAVDGWAADQRFSVVWHGGEPLAVGREHLADLMRPFDERVDHVVQTNATLLDDAWCAFLAEHRVRVGISVDGPPERNAQRVNRGGRPAYEAIMRGVDALRRHAIPFSVICVVSDPRPGVARDLYRFFRDLGCDQLGVNIEEREGVNLRSNARRDEDVRAFWAELVDEWRHDPVLSVREIEWTLRYTAAVLAGTVDDVLPRQHDPIPTIAYNGDVVVLSPELAGFADARYGDFTSGNVLRTPLAEIVANSAGTAWVREFLDGVERCRALCPYFDFCGGGHAANRFFEQGRFDGTETEHCRNSKIRLLEGVLDHAQFH